MDLLTEIDKIDITDYVAVKTGTDKKEEKEETIVLELGAVDPYALKMHKYLKVVNKEMRQLESTKVLLDGDPDSDNKMDVESINTQLDFLKQKLETVRQVMWYFLKSQQQHKLTELSYGTWSGIGIREGNRLVLYKSKGPNLPPMLRDLLGT